MADLSLFNRLRRLFSSDVIIRNIGGNELKVIDTNKIQKSGKYQTNSLLDRFSRLYVYNNRNIFNPNLNYQTLRIQLYSDYEAMDTDPIIASALDVVADECLLRNDRGDMLTITSSDENVRRILNNLFYDVLNVEFNLWSWVRGMLKYGDFFLKLEISEKFGIYNVLPYSVYHISRFEGADPENPTKVYFTLDPDGNATSSDPNYIPKDGRGVIRLENYEVAHFRLLTDTNYLPYGRSYIEPARKIYKQLTLTEDAALIHRIMRAPEKRTFYINVGQIPPNEVENFMQKTINTMKKTPYVGADGQYNLRFNMQNMMEDFYIPVRGGDNVTRVETTPGLNYDGITDIRYYQEKLFSALKIPKAYLGYEGELCVVPETEIPLLDGTTKTVADLIQDHENGIQNYTYSIDEKTLQVVPGKIEWAGWTRKNAQIVRVWLDNEQYIDTTPDHLFMTRDGEWIEAQNLTEGTSLMPWYTGITKRGYTTVYHPGSQTYQEVHRLVPEYYKQVTAGSGKVVHHKDCNKHNNNPENLDCSMDFWQHRAYHAARVKDLVRRLKDQGYYESEKCKQAARVNGKKGGLKSAKKLGEWSSTHHPWNYIEGRDRSNIICPVCGQEFKPTYYGKSVVSEKTRFCSTKCAGQYKHLHPEEYGLVPNRTNKRKFIDLKEFFEVAAKARNFYEIAEHFNINRSTLNAFLKDHGIDKHELVWDVMLEAQKEPNFIRNFRKRRNHKVLKVEFLEERRDTCDIRIEGNHNFATAAGVFIHNSGKATLSAEDIRFARTVERVQRIIESELTKIAIVHLYTQGFTGESLSNFKIKLTTPSVLFEQEKIALLKEKVDLAGQMLDTRMFSTDYIYESIFGISEEDYSQMRNLVREDAKRSFRVSQIENEGNDPAKSGKSYGTPHDLASMYGRRSSPTPKGAEEGKVPVSYEEEPRTHQDWKQPGPEGGRPRIRASFKGTQKDPVGGSDRYGQHELHGGYPSDYSNLMEAEATGSHNVDIFDDPIRARMLEDSGILEREPTMLKESNIAKIEGMLKRLDIPDKLVNKHSK